MELIAWSLPYLIKAWFISSALSRGTAEVDMYAIDSPLCLKNFFGKLISQSFLWAYMADSTFGVPCYGNDWQI